MFELPEKSIACFERWSGTKVTVHGYTDAYQLVLDVMRTKHLHPLCCQTKQTETGKVCQVTDMKMLCWEIGRFRNGGIKRCRAGILEWFLPIWDDAQLQAIVFAGARIAPPGWRCELPFLDFLPAGQRRVAPNGRLMEPGEEAFVLEGLAQLAARLKQFVEPLKEDVLSRAQNIPRDVLIRYLICRNYQKPGQTLEIISQALKLSRSRTLHVIKEETGQNLLELLNTVRLNKARFLLHSSLASVQGISEQCGFGNISNFFRLFRRQHGITPLQYRKKIFDK
ncbi:MAG: helix-turn-helix transcriptional regulator [Victivallales bacterium]|nr:helix-turn-helix transcriptional regulator [Victivallales bacterium]